MRRKQQQGVALVVTLILLSVITFTAITFLVLSRREKGSVATSTDQTVAKLAAETGLERVQGEILSGIISQTNQFNYDLKVSASYYNRYGFVRGDSSLTNVNYESKADGSAFSWGDIAENVANLFYNPRPPVFLFTNRAQTGNADFRFYLDLNRNGRFEANGRQPVVGQSGNYMDTNGQDTGISAALNPPPSNTRSNVMVGDPEWIGILERPDEPHSPSNRFVARYATVLVPSGKTLDLNRVHNQVSFPLDPALPGFRRNMGVGTWEMNLASFLVDLNTNFWTAPDDPFGSRPYLYEPLAATVTGVAFDDANALVRYRYDRDYTRLRSVQNLFSPLGNTDFQYDLIDGYGGGGATGLGFLTNIWVSSIDPDLNRTANPWPGDDNPQQYFALGDLYDLSKTATGLPANNNFAYRLRSAGYGVSTYDRYTYYRMLSQLGTDGGQENGDRVNINYDNKVQRNANGIASVTNFYAWRPLDFFVEAADNLLREYENGHFRRVLDQRYGQGYAADNNLALNIPVMTNGVFVYTPSIHRLLQLAANIYDATTNRNDSGLTNYSSVFRPVFRHDKARGDLFIDGWQDVNEMDAAQRQTVRSLRPIDPIDPAADIGLGDNVYGVPWIIGAKEGFPNFNELSLDNVFEVTRKLEISKPALDAEPNQTNQMFLISINSAAGVEGWNSYRNDLSRTVDVYATNEMRVYLTIFNRPNLQGQVVQFSNIASRVYSPAPWRGTGLRAIPDMKSFAAVIYTNFPILTNSIFRENGTLETRLSPTFDPTSRNKFPIPDVRLAFTNFLQFAIVDRSTKRILDYVHLRVGGETNVSAIIAERFSSGAGYRGLWITNRVGGDQLNEAAPPYGVVNQIDISMGKYGTPGNLWRDYGFGQATGASADKEISAFRSFMNNARMDYPPYTYNSNLVVQVPFTPTKRIRQSMSWQANDPLVHYTDGDLAQVAIGDGVQELMPLTTPVRILKNIGRVNDRYEPWGGNPDSSAQTGSTGNRNYDLRFKDPLVRSSDNWDFPTNKFPSVGWLGRVHRGTPWQTVYMKANEISTQGRGARQDLRDWRDWTGNRNLRDLMRTLPQEDFKLFDLFTATLSDNATTGQMSVNQDGLAAWSAVLGGVIALTNTTPDDSWANYDPTVVITNVPVVIPPAGVDQTNSAVWRIVQGINSDRSREAKKAFQYVGEVLKSEELSVDSPLLNRSAIQRKLGISDAMYERIPQQIMGLLRGNEQPRYVVYTYGQSLKPAERSLVTSGPYYGLCTNYQITAEVAARAVLQVRGAPNNPEVKVESFNLLPPE